MLIISVCAAMHVQIRPPVKEEIETRYRHGMHTCDKVIIVK